MSITEVLIKEYGPIQSAKFKEATKMQDLIDQRRKVLLTKLIDKSLVNELRLGQAPEAHARLYAHITKQEELLKEQTAKKNNNNWVFITVSPKDEIPLGTFVKKMEKLAERSMFLKYTYVFEQRGDSLTTLGKGVHCHMIVKRNLNYKPNKVIRNVLNTTKSIASPKSVDIQFIGDEFKRDKLNYILGRKTGEGKQKKQDFDKIFRRKYNLASVYKTGCRVK